MFQAALYFGHGPVGAGKSSLSQTFAELMLHLQVAAQVDTYYQTLRVEVCGMSHGELDG